VVKGTISDLAAPEKEIYILHVLENQNILQLRDRPFNLKGGLWFFVYQKEVVIRNQKRKRQTMVEKKIL
jgi:hypothetical protein